MTAIRVVTVSHRYGDRPALDHVSFEISRGEVFGLLGPNGGGKTTLFRLLSTLLPVSSGEIHVLGFSAKDQSSEIRHRIGVTFQAPSLDRRLTVRENLQHQGHLYGIRGRDLNARIDDRLAKVGLSDRADSIVGTLSGGLQRRAEIAKGLLHNPELLLLDEPSTGLDPGARHDLWRYLLQLRDQVGVTIVVTTHLMEEAEKCDRLGLLDRGRLVALDSPTQLRADLGGDCVSIISESPESLAARVVERFSVQPDIVGTQLRIRHPQGLDFLRELMVEFPNDIQSVTLGKPSLEDVFIAKTGHQFWDDSNSRTEVTSKRSNQ